MYNDFFDIYYIGLLLLVLVESVFKFSLSSTFSNVKGINAPYLIVLFILLLSLWMGFRPPSDSFGDTILYKGAYDKGEFQFPDKGFNEFTLLCRNLNLSSEIYFSLIAFLYIFLPYVFFYRRVNSSWYGLLFIIGSFSFLGYGINGIRNGLSTSLLLFSFVFLCNQTEKGKDKMIPLIICCILAISIHKSAILPVFCLLLSIFIIKTLNAAIKIWIFSIPVSLLAGGPISSLFLRLGFDERLDGYLNSELSKGFRWDFVLYSIVPIMLAYYIHKKKIVIDRIYQIMIVTYILSNALWILVISASFSNRFAYLSWFMYPFVIVYPILKFRIWEKQMSKNALILLSYFLFSFVMHFFVYN